MFTDAGALPESPSVWERLELLESVSETLPPTRITARKPGGAG